MVQASSQVTRRTLKKYGGREDEKRAEMERSNLVKKEAVRGSKAFGTPHKAPDGGSGKAEIVPSKKPLSISIDHGFCCDRH